MVKLTYQANIKYLPGNSSPDEYDPSQGVIPPDEFVVTRDSDGHALSRYKDTIWIRTPYDPEGRTCHLNFAFWQTETPTFEQIRLATEIRLIMFQLIYLRPGPSLSNGSLMNYQSCLWRMAQFCEARLIGIRNLLADDDLLIEIANQTKSDRIQLSALVNFFRKLGDKAIGFEVATKKTAQALQQITLEWVSGLKQHPPIPTRIYSKILSSIASELANFEQVVDRIVELFQECGSDPLCGRDIERQRVRKIKLGLQADLARRPTFNELLSKYQLEEFWAQKKYDHSIRGLSNSISDMQLLACIQVQAFTGMRLNEARSLPWNSLEAVKRGQDGRVHYLVNGRVTKLTNGKIKRVQWVTSESGRSAILLAQKISSVIYQQRGDHPSKKKARINAHYLFIAAGYALPLGYEQKNVPPLMEFKPTNKIQSSWATLITEEDIRELEHIDPHRAWRTEARFQIGQPWNLTSHQLRRSLALYAQRSGLVSLASLKRQLQHITQEMSLYYARGSIYAKNFIGDGHPEKHFGVEWQETQPLSQYLSYATHVLFAPEQDLFGVHPYWIKNRLQNEVGVVVVDRQATLKRFKKGEMAYRETILGGCVKVGDCDQNPLDLLHVECLTSHCKNMVGSTAKLRRVIQFQTQLVQSLEAHDPGSSEYRHEKANLKVLSSTLDNLTIHTTVTKANA